MSARVLVVDDDPMIGDLVAATARPLGIEVETALTVADCLRQLDDHERASPGALIVDIFMPKEDGFDLVRALHARQSRVPLIFMTGIDPDYLPLAREFCRVCGLEVIDTIAKPIDVKRLRSSLERVRSADWPTPGRVAVLVADDDALAREITAAVLRAADFEVVEAVDGVDALEKLAARPDLALILADLRMPRLGGSDLAREIRRRHPNLKILLCSGEPGDGLLPDGIFLAKPYRVDALVAAVRSALREGTSGH
jgi:CheY-like chemotaxis protein